MITRHTITLLAALVLATDISAAVTQVSVLSFPGVRGNGVNDDTAGIQQAINFAINNKATLYFPRTPTSSSYMATTLTVNGTLSILGDEGAELKQLATATDSMIVTSTDTTAKTLAIRGLTLNGNGLAQLTRSEDVVNKASIIATLNEHTRLVCEGVTFTNTLRAAFRVSGAHYFNSCNFLGIKTNSHAGNGTQGDTYVGFMQPTGWDADLTSSIKNCYAIGQTGWDTNLVWTAAHGFFATEQANNADTTQNTNRFSVQWIGNTAIGLGGWDGSSEGAAFEVYNGANNPTFIGNHCYVYAQSAFKIQRSSGARIIGNYAAYGYNAYTGDGGIYEGVSDAIVFAPNAREGFAPFVGPRAGEFHAGAIIADNEVYCFQQTAVYNTGTSVIIKDNIFSTRVPSPRPPATVALFNSDVRVEGNIFTNIPSYLVVATSPTNSAYSNIWVKGNTTLCGAFTNTSGLFVFQRVYGLRFCENYGRLSPSNNCTFLYIDDCTNALAADNWNEQGTGAIDISMANSASQVECTEYNNNWQPGQWRQSKNALTVLESANLFSTNLVGGATVRVRTLDVGGGIAAYNSNYTGTANSGRVILYNDSTARGINMDLYKSTDDFRGYINGQNRWYFASDGMWYRGTTTAPFILDSDSAVATYQVFRSGGVNKAYWGFSTAVGGLTAIDSTGAFQNMTLTDAGNATFRGSVSGTDGTFSGTLAASALNLATLNVNLLNSTNGVVYVAGATGPAAATIGAGNAAIWASNSVPAQLYVRTTTDGIAVVDTPFP